VKLPAGKVNRGRAHRQEKKETREIDLKERRKNTFGIRTKELLPAKKKGSEATIERSTA